MQLQEYALFEKTITNHNENFPFVLLKEQSQILNLSYLIILLEFNFNKGDYNMYLNNLEYIYEIEDETLNCNDLITIFLDPKNSNIFYIVSSFSYNRMYFRENRRLNYVDFIHLYNIRHCKISKEAFFHIIKKWEDILNHISTYILLYQDENNWIDILSFDTKETIEQFVVDHTKQDAM